MFVGLIVPLVSLLGGTPAQAPLHVTPPALHASAGTLTSRRLHLWAPVTQGATHQDLHAHVGHLPASYLPGMGGTIVLFGHDVTQWRGRRFGPFHGLPRLQVGDVLTYRVAWGTYRYRVTGHHLISRTAWGAIRPRLDGERLVLATCWPRYTSNQRWVVSARPVD